MHVGDGPWNRGWADCAKCTKTPEKNLVNAEKALAMDFRENILRKNGLSVLSVLQLIYIPKFHCHWSGRKSTLNAKFTLFILSSENGVWKNVLIKALVPFFFILMWVFFFPLPHQQHISH